MTSDATIVLAAASGSAVALWDFAASAVGGAGDQPQSTSLALLDNGCVPPPTLVASLAMAQATARATPSPQPSAGLARRSASSSSAASAHTAGTAPASIVRSLSWSPASLGGVLAVGGVGADVRLFDSLGQASSAVAVPPPLQADSEVLHALFDRDASSLVMATSRREVVAWDLSGARRSPQLLYSHRSAISCMALGRVAPLVVSGTSRGSELVVFNRELATRADMKPPTKTAIHGVDTSARNRNVVAGCSDDGHVFVLDTQRAGPVPLRLFQRAHAGPAKALVFNAFQTALIHSAGYDKMVHTHDINAKSLAMSIDTGYALSSVAAGIDQYTIAAGTTTGSVLLYDTRSPAQPLWTSSVPAASASAAARSQHGISALAFAVLPSRRRHDDFDDEHTPMPVPADLEMAAAGADQNVADGVHDNVYDNIHDNVHDNAGDMPEDSPSAAAPGESFMDTFSPLAAERHQRLQHIRAAEPAGVPASHGDDSMMEPLSPAREPLTEMSDTVPRLSTVRSSAILQQQPRVPRVPLIRSHGSPRRIHTRRSNALGSSLASPRKMKMVASITPKRVGFSETTTTYLAAEHGEEAGRGSSSGNSNNRGNSRSSNSRGNSHASPAGLADDGYDDIEATSSARPQYTLPMRPQYQHSQHQSDLHQSSLHQAGLHPSGMHQAAAPSATLTDDQLAGIALRVSSSLQSQIRDAVAAAIQQQQQQSQEQQPQPHHSHQQQTTPVDQAYSTSIIRTAVQEAFGQVEQSLRGEIRNLHVELLRRTLVVEQQLSRLAERADEADGLRAELARLRSENDALRNSFL